MELEDRECASRGVVVVSLLSVFLGLITSLQQCIIGRLLLWRESSIVACKGHLTPWPLSKVFSPMCC